MAESIKSAAYRLKVVTFKDKAFEVYSVVYGQRTAVILNEPPMVMTEAFRVKVVTFSEPPFEIYSAVYAQRTAIIFGEPPLVYVNRFRAKAVTASQPAFDIFSAVYAQRTAVVFAAPPSTVYAQRTAVIFEQVELGPPAQVSHVYNDVTAARPVPPLNQVISTERVSMATSMTIQAQDVSGFPWSNTRTAQEVVLVLQSKPNYVQSYQFVRQTYNLSAGAVNYIIPDDVWSPEYAAQQMMLVLQSIDIPFTPVSGVFASQSYQLTTIESDPLPMWTSPAFYAQEQMLVLWKRSFEGLPRSLTRVGLSTTQAVTARDPEGLPIGEEIVPQVTSQAVSPTVMDEPFSHDDAAQNVLLVAQASPLPVYVGVEFVRQQRHLVLQARVQPLPLSLAPVSQERLLVLAKADYPSLEDSLARTRTAQVRNLAVAGTFYPPASTPSYTRVAQGRVTFAILADASFYPDPEDMYQASRYIRTPQFTEMVTSSLSLPLWLSFERVPQMRILTGQKANAADYPDPEDMANSGIFLRQASQRVMMKADYPSTDVPGSNVIAAQVAQHVASVADYPSAHLPVNYAIIPQLSEQLALTEEYPDPSTLTAPLNVLQVAEQIGLETSYPDAGTLHAPVLALQLTEQLSLRASYPDKDMPQSYARVAQLSQQAAFRATYPNKDVPQSIAKVNQVRQQVARRDLTMYQLPVPPRRHRVRIVCRFVY